MERLAVRVADITQSWKAPTQSPRITGNSTNSFGDSQGGRQGAPLSQGSSSSSQPSSQQQQQQQHVHSPIFMNPHQLADFCEAEASRICQGIFAIPKVSMGMPEIFSEGQESSQEEEGSDVEVQGGGDSRLASSQRKKRKVDVGDDDDDVIILSD